MQEDGSIRVETKDRPSQVLLWQATNPKARDFRLETLGRAYTGTPLAPEKEGVYVARVPKPAEGWTAFFADLTFPSGGMVPYNLTIGVRVVPDPLPFPALGKRSGGPASSLPEAAFSLPRAVQPSGLMTGSFPAPTPTRIEHV